MEIEEDNNAAPVILITSSPPELTKSPSDVAIIKEHEANNNNNNNNNNNSSNNKNINNEQKTPPASPSLSPSSPSSPTSPSQSLLRRSLTKTSSLQTTKDDDKKLQKRPSIFDILSPFNTKGRKDRELAKSLSSPDFSAAKSKKDCSIVVKVFEARNIPEARQRKKIVEKNTNTIKRAQKMMLEVTSPNLMSFSDATDPYCLVQVERTKMRTRTIEKKLNPFWCEEFTFEVLDSAKSKVVLSVIDDKKYAQQGEVIGKLVLPINSFKDQREREQWFPLQPPSSSSRIPQIFMYIDYKLVDGKPVFNFQILGGRNLVLGTTGGVPQVDLTWKLKDTKALKEASWAWNDIHSLATVIELPAPLETFQISVWKWKAQNDLDQADSTATPGQSETKEKVIIGQVSIPLVDLSAPRDYWFCLYGKEASYGDLRVKIKYTEEVVLSLEQYQDFLDLLQDPNLMVIRTLAAVAKPNTREGIAYNLVRVFEVTDKAIYLINTLNSDEIDSTPNPDIIFRGNSLATKTVDQYMKLVGMPYLSHVLKVLIRKLYISQKGCEVDPSKLEKGEDLKQNWKNLLSWVNLFTESIFGSLEFCPKPFREIFREIRQKCISKFPEDLARFTAVSGFIFLRFFCPAILAPKLFNLAPDHPDLKQARHLILIAKTLQNLANLVEFGVVKEEFMKNMNEFVVANLDNMKNFIHDIATVPENAPPGAPDTINLEKELASMYRHILKHRDEMIRYQKEKGDAEAIAAMEKLNTILAKIERDVALAKD